MLLSTLSSSWIQHAPALGAVGWSATEFSQLIASNTIPLEYERHMFVGILNTLFYLIASLFTPETVSSVDRFSKVYFRPTLSQSELHFARFKT